MKTTEIPLKEVLNFFFPIRCIVCEQITNMENTLCVKCASSLKYSRIQNHMGENELIELFHGRVDLKKAYYHFKNDDAGISKKLIHEIKYKSNLGLMKLIGESIDTKVREGFRDHVILPVPLSQQKLKSRGFNQSKLIADSVFDEDRLKPNLVVRKENTRSQTGFGKFQRWRNMEGAFEVNAEEINKIPKDSSILIVDDVVTTGSTVESIFIQLRDYSNEFKFSLFSLLKA